MSSREIKKHVLDFKRTFPYFIDHIESGKTLSRKAVKKINFQQGDFYTLLPLNAELNRLYEFSYGGIIPPVRYGDQLYAMEGYPDGFQPLQVQTMDQELSAFIFEYVMQSSMQYAIVENCLLEVNDFAAKIADVKITTYQNEVYYLLDKKNSIDQIYNTVRKSATPWHFLAILTTMNNTKLIHFTDEDFDQICDSAKFVIAGAYDGEGYIFWEKKVS